MNTFFNVSAEINQRKKSRLIGDVDKVLNQIFVMKQSLNANDPISTFIDYIEKGLAQVIVTFETDNDLAWRNFKTLRRMLIQGFNKDQCLTEIKYLLGSSARISGWQQATIAGLFPAGYENLSLDTLQTNLQSATEIKDEYFDDEYSRFYTSQIYVTRILYIFVIAITLFTLIYSIGVNCFKLDCFLGSPKYIIAFEIFGFLGAVFSVVTRFTSSTSTQDINSLQYESSPLLRTTVGPGAALIMYLFIQSQVINPSFFKLSDKELSGDTTKVASLKKALIDTSTNALTVEVKIDSLKRKDTTKAVTITKVALKPTVIKVAETCTDCKNTSVTPSFLMFILAFLAGFSEKLVVQILNKLSDKVK